MLKLKEIKAYDIDGVLVCSLHRYRTGENGRIDLDHWIKHDTAEFISKDSLLPMAEQYKKDLLNPEVYVILATARVLKQADHDYIAEHLGLPDQIFGRVLGQKTSGGILKVKALAFLKQLKQFRDLPITFFEDNIDYLKKVCDNLNCRGVYIPSKQGY